MSDVINNTKTQRPLVLTVMGLIVCAAMLAMPILVGAPGNYVYPDIVRFIGRFHPVILHLPIGMLVLALILEFGSFFTRKESPALQSTLFFTAATSVVAVLAGFLLFQTDDHADSPGAVLHLWGGIAFSCLCICTFLVKAWTDAGASAAWFYKFLLVTTSGVMAYASHEGATLTHGSDYLGEYAPGPLREILGGKPLKEEIKAPSGSGIEVVAEPLVYQDIVAPILEEKCWKCHNEKKIKGKLRMDTYELLVKGGDEGPALEVGHAEKSRIVNRMELPIDDEDRMPPDEKPGISTEDLAVIKWWINAGAKTDLTLAAANPPADIAATIAKRKPAAKSSADVTPTPPPADVSSTDVSKERANIQVLISELQKSFPGAAQFESQASNAVNFTAVSMRGSFSDADAQKIAAIAASLSSVDLTATLVTDAVLATLQPAKNLRTLRLGETPITDTGLATIATFASLESLNLFGTQVTDAGIQQLATLKNLKRLYLWRSKVTPEGVETLRKALPKCEMIMGI